MFAIVATSGKQFRVSEGDRIVVDRVSANVGETVRLDSVLLVGGDGGPMVGTPFVSGPAAPATPPPPPPPPTITPLTFYTPHTLPPHRNGRRARSPHRKLANPRPPPHRRPRRSKSWHTRKAQGAHGTDATASASGWA